ncbi:unnamed protein product [Phyllotreta striolata]|uniref:Uncharacterized protein n=1 Tax=Phyllotreta striolata TaxID=444603 RepID=A0A9N9TIG2_PHYSR|nr:unnamed protein product [Phyllotreta striolata]
MDPTTLIICIMLSLSLFCILLVLFIKCVLSCLESSTFFRSHNWKPYENETYEVDALSLQSVNLQHVASSSPLVHAETALVPTHPPRNRSSDVLQTLVTGLAEDAVTMAEIASTVSRESPSGCDSLSFGSVIVECLDLEWSYSRPWPMAWGPSPYAQPGPAPYAQPGPGAYQDRNNYMAPPAYDPARMGPAPMVQPEQMQPGVPPTIGFTTQVVNETYKDPRPPNYPPQGNDQWKGNAYNNY